MKEALNLDLFEMPYTPAADVLALLEAFSRLPEGPLWEIGCGEGYTTRILSEAFPDRMILAMDGGRDTMSPKQWPERPRQIGRLVRGRGNVEIMEANSLLWHPDRQFAGVFIDGDHTLGAVLADTQRALECLLPGGVIAWHDYEGPDGGQTGWCGVTRAVDFVCGRISQHVELIHPFGTRLAWIRKPELSWHRRPPFQLN